jgi:hypothetical protein
MKANKVINSINFVLNEDAYSKFSTIQLYQKLGHDGFITYFKNVFIKAITRASDDYSGLKNHTCNVREDTDRTVIMVESSKAASAEVFIIYFYGPELKQQIATSKLFMSYTVNLITPEKHYERVTDSSSLLGSTRNLYASVSSVVEYLYNLPSVEKIRLVAIDKKNMNDPAREIKPSDYHKYTPIELSKNMSLEDFSKYISKCFSTSVKRYYNPVKEFPINLKKIKDSVEYSHSTQYVEILRHKTFFIKSPKPRLTESFLIGYHTKMNDQSFFSLNYTFSYDFGILPRGKDYVRDSVSSKYLIKADIKGIETRIDLGVANVLASSKILAIKTACVEIMKNGYE